MLKHLSLTYQRIIFNGTAAIFLYVHTTDLLLHALCPDIPGVRVKLKNLLVLLRLNFIAGSSFEDFLDLQNKLKDFQRDVNQRVHSTTKTIPKEVKGLLHPNILTHLARLWFSIKIPIK